MRQLLLLIITGVLFLAACAPENIASLPFIDISGKPVPLLRFSDVKDTIALSLSQILDDVACVKLETRDDNKLAGGKWSAGQKYIIGFCYDLGIFQFTSDGKFIRKLANMGNGPLEVSYPVWAISKDESYIIIYDPERPKSYLCLDLNSGLLIKTIPVALEGTLKNIYIESDSVLICAPLIGTGKPAGDCYIFWQNLSGKLINVLPAQSAESSHDNGENLLYPVGGSYNLRPVNGDTIYRITGFRKQPSFIFDTRNNLISPESDIGRTTFTIFAETSGFMIVGTFTITEQISMGPNAFRSKGKSSNYYIDKNKNRAYRISTFINDYLGEKQGPAIIRNQTGDLRYFSVEPIALLKKIETLKSDPDIEVKNRNLVMNSGLDLNENDNPVLFIGRMQK